MVASPLLSTSMSRSLKGSRLFKGAALFGLGAVTGFQLARRAPAPALPARSNDIISHASEAIISTDRHNTIVMANSAAAAMFATTVEAMQQAPLGRFLSPLPASADGPPLYFSDSGRTGRRATDYAVTGIRADGSTFPIEGSASTVIEHGEPIHTIILRDVTDRQEVHEKLSRSHTHLGQLLATLRMDLTLLRRDQSQGHSGGNNGSAIKLIDGMEQNLMTAITSLRRIATNLRPRALDEGGLFFALQGLRNEFVERYGFNCTLYADEAELRLGDTASTAIFRIVQEALTNIARHAHASNVTITLYRVDSEVLLTVRDDGCGIQPGDLDKAASLGLVGMRERVLALNGDITISGEEPSGTRIDIVLPLLVRTD